jgi:hypothetical protein
LRVTICYVLSLWPCYNISFGLHYCPCLCFGLLLNLCCKFQVHTYVTQWVSSKTCLETMVESIHCILDYKPNRIAFFSSLSFLFFSFLLRSQISSTTSLSMTSCCTKYASIH